MIGGEPHEALAIIFFACNLHVAASRLTAFRDPR